MKEKLGLLEKELCDLLESYNGNVAIESFNPLSISYIKKYKPEFIRGLLCSSFKEENMNFLKKFVLRNFLLNFKCKPLFIAYNIQDLPNRKIKSFKKKGISIIGWTARNKSNYDNAMKYCENVIFEGMIPTRNMFLH